MVTPIYAALAGFFFVYLSFKVIGVRRENRIGIESGDNMELKRAIRVHGNFAEYVPLSLVLLYFFESLTGLTIVVHVLGIMLLVGRALHAHGVSKVDENIRFRQRGMILTFFVINACGVGILISYLMKLF